MTKSKFAALICVASTGALAVPDQTVVNYRVDSTNNSQPTEHDVQVLVPVYHGSESQIFVQGNLRYDNETSMGGGVAVGFRAGQQDVYGVNVFYDTKNHHGGETYSQVGVGGEYFGTGVEAHANYYLPVSSDKTFQSGQVIVDGNNITGQATSLIGHRGGDIEIAARLYSSPDVEFWANVGAFNYTPNEGDGSEKGGSVGIELRTPIANGGSVRLGVKGEHVNSEVGPERDDTRFYASVNYPFGGTGGLPEYDGSRGYLETTKRKGSIVRAAKFNENLVNPFTAREVQSIWFADGTNTAAAGAPGTGVESNPTDLTTALASAGADSVVVVQGNDGLVVVAPNGEQMQVGQLLLGGGSTHAFTGAESGGSYSYTASGTRPTIVGNPGDVSITMATDAQIQGVDFQGGRDAIATGSSNHVRIADVNIDGPSRYGVLVNSGADDVLIEDFTTANTGAAGIHVDDVVDGVVIRNGTVTNAGVRGINFAGTAGNEIQNVLVENVNINTTADDGLRFAYTDNVTVRNVNITNAGNGAGEHGVEVSQVDGIIIEDLTVDTTARDGVNIANSTNIMATNVDIDNAGDDGFVLNNTTNSTVTNLDVAMSNNDGVRVVNGASQSTFNGVTVDMSGNDGIEVDNAMGTTINNATVMNSGDTGIRIDNGADNTVVNNSSVADSGDDGVRIENANTTTLSNVDVTRSSDDGIVIRTSNGNTQAVIIEDSAMSLSGDNALTVNHTNAGSVTSLQYNNNDMQTSGAFNSGEHIEFVNTNIGYTSTGAGNTADNGSATCNGGGNNNIMVTGSFPGAC